MIRLPAILLLALCPAVEGDEPRQQVLGGAEVSAHCVLQFRLRVVCGLSSENAGTCTSMRSPASVVIW